MAISIGKLLVVYSGGAANEDQAASLGGAISTAASKKVKSQSTTALSLVTGVTILDAMGNAEGAGILRYDYSSNALLWKPYGGVTFDGVGIPADGIYTLGTTGGYVIVDVVKNSLPGSTQQDSVTVANIQNATFDNISAQESLVGDTEYRCFYVLNSDSTQTAYDVRIWIKTQPVGDDELFLALDPNGKNAQARGPLANEGDSTNVLAGMAFTQPATQPTGLVMGDLAPGQYYAFWVKRVIPSNTTNQVLKDTSAIGISTLI